MRDGAALPALAELREAADPVEAVRELADRMLRNAYGLERPPADAASRVSTCARTRRCGGCSPSSRAGTSWPAS